MNDSKLPAPATSPASDGSARGKFKWGMRVKMSGVAMNNGLGGGKMRYGIVTGFGKKNPSIVRVLRENTSTPLTYHMELWDEDEPNADLSDCAGGKLKS